MLRHKDRVNLRESIVERAAYHPDNIKKYKALLVEKAANGRKLRGLAFQRSDQARLHNDDLDLCKHLPLGHSAQNV